jgi:HAD-hyrolase-like
MVGDRLDTDVLFGTDNGLMSVLVLSGVTSEQKLLSHGNPITPDYYCDSINDFFGSVRPNTMSMTQGRSGVSSYHSHSASPPDTANDLAAFLKQTTGGQ